MNNVTKSYPGCLATVFPRVYFAEGLTGSVTIAVLSQLSGGPSDVVVYAVSEDGRSVEFRELVEGCGYNAVESLDPALCGDEFAIVNGQVVEAWPSA